jgi:hypothetical protein
MNLRPFLSKRRARRADLWGLAVTSRIEPLSLAPSEDANHNVSLENKDSMAYDLTVHGYCGPLLRYGKAKTWGPHERTLSPGEQRPLKGKIGLPASCDDGDLPCFEQVELNTEARPVNPHILIQKASVYHDVKLKKK